MKSQSNAKFIKLSLCPNIFLKLQMFKPCFLEDPPVEEITTGQRLDILDIKESIDIILSKQLATKV